MFRLDPGPTILWKLDPDPTLFWKPDLVRQPCLSEGGCDDDCILWVIISDNELIRFVFSLSVVIFKPVLRGEGSITLQYYAEKIFSLWRVKKNNG